MKRGDWRRADGASAVEMAIILPLLLMMVFGIMYFGFVFAQELSLGNAARQAARYGVVRDLSTTPPTQPTCGDIAGVVNAEGPTIGMSSSDFSVVVTRESSAGTVEVDCTSAGPGVVPCVDSQSGDVLRVVATHTGTQPVSIPFGPGLNNHPVGEGVFRCEFG